MSSPSEYLVGATIGEGSYGRVVHARHKSSRRDVAIKVVDKVSLKKYPHLYHGVWTERTLLSEWNCEYVTKLYASFHDSECVYLVMECEMGGDLASVMNEGQQKKSEQWSLSIPHYGLQLVAALEFVHSQGVIHADLKPDNVLLSTGGRLKLADFGSAIRISEKRKTGEPRVMGTSDFASPEVLRASNDLTFAIDLWSLGCIYYAMWVGQSPFHSQSDDLAVRAVLDFTSVHRDDNVVRKNVSDDAWQKLVLGLLCPEPSKRTGVSDFADPGRPVEYTAIRSLGVWDNVVLSSEPPFLPSMQKWAKETQDSQMRDGDEGWSAFLL